MIDPRALIDPTAKIADSVTIGAFSIIGADVEIGEGTWIGSHVVIKGPTKIGKNNKIYQFASLGEDPQDKKYAGERSFLEIGDHNEIREFCTMSRGTSGGGGITKIGNHNWLMVYTHFAHDCIVGDHTIFANNASLAGHAIVGDYAILGGFTGVHQFCRIGAHSFVAGGSIVIKDVPPYVMAAGNSAKANGLNKEGLKRRGFSPETLNYLRQAYKIIYRQNLTTNAAIETLTQTLLPHCPEIQNFIDFLHNATRGIVR